MYALLGSLVALVLAPASADPRSIDDAANRPEIVSPAGAPAKIRPVKVRRPKRDPKAAAVPEPEPEPEVQPRRKPRRKPRVEPETQPEVDAPRRKPKPRRVTRPPKPGVDEATDEECFPARGLCRRLNVAGIATASVAVGMVGTGVGFMLAPTFPANTGLNEPVFDRSLRPPGVVLVALGSVTAVTGVLMIVAGHAVHARARRRPMAKMQVFAGGLRW
ncbi:MAG: hypothetical protein AB1Z98_26925 [Nannocystaceae bacterium]